MKRQKTSDFIVDTNGSCFICSSACNSSELCSSSTTPASYLSSLHALSQYLKVDISEVFHEKESIPPELLNNVKSSKLKVLLCGQCTKWNTRISALCLQLEKIETEVCFYLELIHGSLLRLDGDDKTNGPYKLDNVDAGSSGELLEKFRIVKSLRTETMKKCSQKFNSAQYIVRVQNLNAKQILSKQRRIKLKSSKEYHSNVGNSTGNAFGGSGTDEEQYFDDNDNTDNAEYIEDPIISQEESNDNNDVQNTLDDQLHPARENRASVLLKNEPATVKNVTPARPLTLESPSATALPSSSSRNIEKLTFVINSQTGKLKCNICSVEFKSKPHLKQHYEGIHLKIRHKCNLCGKEFAHKRDHTRHHRTAHVGVRYKCNLCGKCFTQKFSLATHQRSVHLGIRYQCKFCEKSFTHKGDMTKHDRLSHRQ